MSSQPIGPAVTLTPPLGLPPVPIPADNPPTASAIALGRRLFYDTSFSKDNSLSCASCHNPASRFSDTHERSLGVGGTLGMRHAPSIINAAYLPLLFWDGRAQSLESQMLIPMADPLEMNQPHKLAIEKLKRNPEYKALFRQAFGSDDITLQRVEKALASFERTILCGNSAFDRYEYGHQKDALSPAQIRGLAAFRDPHRGNCAACHTIGPNYALFTDGGFHNTGEGVNGDGALTDAGRSAISKNAAETGAFKTPTLRDIAVSGPYMHDGKLKTLKDVVDFYAGGGNSNPHLDQRMSVIHLSAQDRSDLVQFMQSLTCELPSDLGPPGKDSSR